MDAVAGAPEPSTDCRILLGDNLELLRAEVPNRTVSLIYIDPPFNTGRTQRRQRLTAVADAHGDRQGFAGRQYRSTPVASPAGYADRYDDYIEFLRPRLLEGHRTLTDNGSLFLHVDFREAHYCKILLDELFGRDSFINEIIWAYDFGGRSKRRWPTKHDTIFWYAKDPKNYIFQYENIDRIPYLAPSLVGAERAARGKTPTDVWWNTIVPTNSREKTGYPTQKPLAIVERILLVHSMPGDTVLDFFAGSGTLGVAARKHGRASILIDSNPEAVTTMEKRLGVKRASPKSSAGSA